MARALIASVLLVLPFIILEWMNQGDESFPVALFVALWLLSRAFVVLLKKITRLSRLHLLLRLAGLVLIAGAWTGLVIDQMPCFLGMPNCD